VGGHPQAPRHGDFAPLDPPLPTPVGFGFANVLGPTRGVVANVGDSFPLLVLWGDTPHTPCQGASPPWTPVCPPPLAKGSPAFWGPLVAWLLMWAPRSLF